MDPALMEIPAREALVKAPALVEKTALRAPALVEKPVEAPALLEKQALEAPAPVEVPELLLLPLALQERQA
jgi:hypothetical protein